MRALVGTAVAAGLIAASNVQAGLIVYEDGDKFVEVGGRIQLQYYRENPEVGASTDSWFFRRLRPYIAGSKHKDWYGKWQWDMGKAEGGNELAVKDAYIRYSGWAGHKLYVGNVDFPFSREYLTSSKKSTLVERGFAGDHNYGTPDKNLGIKLQGSVAGGRFGYAFGIANASVDPDDSKLDFDTPMNRNDDFNEGTMVGGRLSIAPMGAVSFAQGYNSGAFKFAVEAGAFGWSNDGDNNVNTDPVTGLDVGAGKPDVDKATGTEAVIALRGYGLSLDLQGNKYKAETIDGTYGGGLYSFGEAELTQTHAEAGYMIVAKRLEIAAGAQSQDADTYTDKWMRRSVGLNYFVHGHDLKIQATLRNNYNNDGVTDKDSREVFVQTQYVF
ncbi:MAG: hypothetical protein IME93_07625 [Proteobacteria bacterium]|nr:hypothetical protein [Pseudomonadota bacterium]